MPSKTLVIFDLDGTLFKSETVTIPAVADTCRAFGLPTPADAEICSFFGRPHRDFHEWLRAIGPAERLPDFLAAIDRREMENVTLTGSLFPGVHDALERLKKNGHLLAICTNGEREYVNAVIRGHGLLPLFSLVRHRMRPEDTKPGMVGDLLAGTGLRRGCVIGDRSDDMKAAHDNGLFAVGASYGYGSPEELAGADALADSLIDIPGIVDRLLGQSETRRV